MTLANAVQIGAKVTPEIFVLGKNLLYELGSFDQVIDTTKKVVEAVSASTTDGGISKNIFKVRKAFVVPNLRLFLNSLKGSLNIDTVNQANSILDVLETEGGNLTEENRNNLIELIEGILFQKQNDSAGGVVEAGAAVVGEAFKMHASGVLESGRQLEALFSSATAVLDPLGNHRELIHKFFGAIGQLNGSVNGKLFGEEHTFLEKLTRGELPLDRENFGRAIHLAEKTRDELPVDTEVRNKIVELVKTDDTQTIATTLPVVQHTEPPGEPVPGTTAVKQEAKTPEASPSPDQKNPQEGAKVYTQEEVDKLIHEKLEHMGLTGEGVPKDPIDRILNGASGIIIGEFKNLNSPVGWMIKAYSKISGNPITKEKVNNFLLKFVDDKFKSRLVDFVKAKVSGKDVGKEFFAGLTENEERGVKWLGKIIRIGTLMPNWVFDAIAFSGEALDWSAELLHNVPVLGFVLKIPGMRKLYTGLGSFCGRFANDLEKISSGAKELKGEIEGVNKVAPAAATTASSS